MPGYDQSTRICKRVRARGVDPVNLTLYDGSMGEWAKDLSLPIETD